MLFEVISLSWFDIITFATFITAVIYVSIVSKQQQLLQNDHPNKSPQSSNVSASNSSTLPPPSPTEYDIQDEFHEDEDNLSLDSLFPCDQSEIYESKKISFIIEELIQTEASYVDKLKLGVRNYGGIFAREDLPETLQGKKADLMGNIEKVLELHENQILPIMQQHQRDLKALFDEFSAHIDKNDFYCYVTFTMNKKTSMQLRQNHREYFSTLQTELNDKLGIDSFLVQPIQRLTRYPLLLQQFISEFYKADIKCKPVLTSCCKLETRLRNLLSVVNQSEEIKSIEDLNELNILEQGYFRKSNEFDAYNHKSRKKYRYKVFLFDKCLLCTEVRKKRLSYRCHYSWESIAVTASNSKTFVVTHKVLGRPEYEFTAGEAIVIKHWMRAVLRITEAMKSDFGRIASPLQIVFEVVLGAGFVIWFMFRLHGIWTSFLS